MKYLCFAAETGGLAKECPVLEFGWFLFDPAKPDEGDGDIALIEPGEDAVFEPGAVETHQKSGLLEAFAEHEAKKLEDMLSAAHRATGMVRDTFAVVFWSKDFLRERVGKQYENFPCSKLDFATMNAHLAILTNGTPVKPAASRVLNKLAAMKDVITHWHAVFALAEKKP